MNIKWSLLYAAYNTVLSVVNVISILIFVVTIVSINYMYQLWVESSTTALIMYNVSMCRFCRLNKHIVIVLHVSLRFFTVHPNSINRLCACKTPQNGLVGYLLYPVSIVGHKLNCQRYSCKSAEWYLKPWLSDIRIASQYSCVCQEYWPRVWLLIMRQYIEGSETGCTINRFWKSHQIKLAQNNRYLGRFGTIYLCNTFVAIVEHLYGKN